jgi:hypothetical protein
MLRRPLAEKTSTARVSAPQPTSSQVVAGKWPASRAAIVRAPQARNSPCGMKMTRVTANTSTSARASSA